MLKYVSVREGKGPRVGLWQASLIEHWSVSGFA
jgi:hypothetical protein